MGRITLICICVISCAANLADAATTALQCGRMIDVRALEVLTERTIVVEEKRIVRIERGYITIADANTIDLRNQTCMPGLIDLHVHLAFSLTPNATVEGFSFNPADYAVRAVGNAEKNINGGFYLGARSWQPARGWRGVAQRD